MSRRIAIWAAPFLVLTFVSLGLEDESRAETKPAETKKEYTTVAKSVRLKAGAEGSATVSIVAGKGFKWNKEYPAKLFIEGTPKHVALKKTQFKQFGGDFKTTEKRADVTLNMTGKAEGKESLQAKAKFSVCNDTTCVIREANIKVTVNVTK